MKRVLITGATGFVGRNVFSLLARKNYEVHGVSSKIRLPAEEGVYWHNANLLKRAETASLIANIRPTHLLHFAWCTDPSTYWKSEENFDWLDASIALLRQFGKAGGKRVVMAGTCAEYDWNFGYCTEATTPRMPATPYGVCKNLLQEYTTVYSKEKGLSSAWGRIFFLYGPNEHPARLVASVITELMRGNVARCTNGKQHRDYMHVEDAASAFVELLDSSVEGAVNIASGQPIAVRDLVLEVAGQLSVELDRVKFGALPLGDNEPPLIAGNPRRLAEELCWQPKFQLREGIASAVQYWRSRSGV